ALDGGDAVIQQIRFANVGLRLGTPDRAIVIVRDGSGAFDIIGASGTTAGGIAGRMQATVELLIPGVTFSGTLAVQLNTLASPQTVDGTLIRSGIAVAGLDVTLEVVGQRLTGDFAFAKNATTQDIMLMLSDVTLELGDGTQTYVTATITSGVILVTRAGIVGALVAGIELDPDVLPGVTVNIDAIVQINNTAADIERSFDLGPSSITLSIPKSTLRVQVGLPGAPAEISILDQTLTGVAIFEQRKTATGTKIVRLAFADVSLFLGDQGADGSIDDATEVDPDDVGLYLSNGNGAFIITPTGMAGEVSGKVVLRGLPIDITASLTLQVNTLLVAGQGVVVTEVFQFAGVTVTTTTDGNADRPEEQTISVGVPAGTFTLAIDANTDGTLAPSEMSAPIAFDALPSVVDDAIEALLDADAGTDLVTVAAVTGGYTVTWNDDGNQAALQPNVRVLSLPKGPFLRVAASDIDVVFTGANPVTIHVDGIAFERSGPTPALQVTTIAFVGASIATGQNIGSDNPGLKEASGVLVVFPRNAVTDASTTPDTVTLSGGVAGMLTGKVDAGSGTFPASASVGFAVNTTGVVVDQTVEVGDTEIVLDLTAARFVFIVQDLDFSFGDILEIRAGQFALSGDSFSGEGLEIFIGSGPSKLANGDINPAAIGVLIRNASITFIKGSGAGSGWAMRAIGTIALLGLDGLGISGTVAFQVNASDSLTLNPGDLGAGMTGAMAPGVFSFTATDVVITAGSAVTLGGSIRLTRERDGTLGISLWNATAMVTVGGENVVSITGFATFSISPTTGFQLGSFRVTDFQLRPTGPVVSPTSDPVPVIVTADLVTPLKNAVLTAATLTTITVVFTPTAGTINLASVTDAAAEITVSVAGSTGVWVVDGIPTAVVGKANTWMYSVSGPALPGTGVVTVRFIEGSITANHGAGLTALLVGEEEKFYVFTPTAEAPRPGPLASLTVASVSQAQLNAQGYIDLTYTSLPATTGGVADPILKSSIETAATAPFQISGLIGDLAVSATGVPLLIGTPLLISGAAANATAVTYRYFLKDKNPGNTLGLFSGTGNVTITMIAGKVAAGSVSNQTQSLTLAVSASAVGERTEGGPIALGPLTLQGPTVGLGGFGFADGKVLVSVIVGVQRASLAFGGSPTTGATSTAQTNSGITVDLVGVMGSFELAVDVFGLLGGNVDVRLTGKWSLQVASLDAQIPNVARLQATGIKVTYDPKGAADQEIVKVNTATITFPSFGITGSIRPYDPATSSNILKNNDEVLGAGVIPGLTVYGNGFRLGTAELAYGLPPTTGAVNTANALTPSAPDKKITFGGILELDDIRIGISGLDVRFPVDGAPATDTAGFTGIIYIASGGAKLFPGKAYGATLTDRLTADDKRPDGTLDDEAFRIALTFADGKVDAFQLTVDTLEIRLGTYVTLTARDFRLDTGATGSDIMVQFGAVGAKVT
ncbi:MAG TPA: hypothetical protein VF364_10120, partial [Candidatus Limnocylindria bacterium]